MLGRNDGKLGAEADAASAKYHTWKEASADLEELRAKEQDRTGRLDYLTFQLEEIERIDPKQGEIEELEAELSRLRNAERLDGAVKGAALSLYESDGSVYDRLGSTIRDIESVMEYDPALEAPREQLLEAAAIVEEAASVFIRYDAMSDPSAGTLDETDDRLDELRRLQRKHNLELAEIIELKKTLKEEIDTLSKYDEAIAEASKRVKAFEKEASVHAGRLTKKRKRAAKALAKVVTAELFDLSFGGSRFDVRVEPTKSGLGPRGADQVEFLVALNEGEGTHPIAKIASGGELSRLMLAIKRALLGVGPVGTYVFDEVDAGIGGGVAAAVGKKLRAVAKKHQLICITHLPQIAGMASAHFVVSKKTGRGRTTSRIDELSAKKRIEELARMLGGEKVTDKTRAAARELMQDEA